VQLPDAASLFFLIFVLVVLPIASLHSGRQLRASAIQYAPDSLRRRLWIGSAVNLLAILALAWFVGRSFRYPFFAAPPVTWTAVGATIGALMVCLALRAISEALRDDDERQSILVYWLVPHNARDWLLWTPVVFIAAISEEIAYRGVATAILQAWLHNPWLAALIAAAGFAAAHALQGWKSGVIIFFIALVMHALVAITGTLVYAMLVHAVYDFIAGYLAGRDASRTTFA
jgi:membrane protease YdiL (CAAX protease family)